MLQEPAHHQMQTEELGELVMHCNMLVSEIATLAHTRMQHPEISQSPEYASTALAVDAALAGSAITPEDQPLPSIPHDLLAARQSASRIQQICAQLKLPGMSKTR